MPEPIRHEVKQFKRGRVCPMGVLEHAQDRFPSGEALELIEQCREYLATLLRWGQTERWIAVSERGEVDAMPEGTAFFDNEPILRVTAPLPRSSAAGDPTPQHHAFPVGGYQHAARSRVMDVPQRLSAALASRAWRAARQATAATPCWHARACRRGCLTRRSR
jgi:hypothetical protein